MVKNTMFKLIALDIDGTLKVSGGTISNYTKSILSKCKDAGTIVVIATGRSRKSADPIVNELDVLDYLVSFQGALITGINGNQPVWAKVLDRERLIAINKGLKGWEVEKVAYVEDFICVERMTKWARDYSERNGVEIKLVADLCSLEVDPYRVLAVGEEGDVERLEKEMNLKLNGYVYSTRSLPNYCEFLNPEAGKEKALDWICEKHGIKSEEVLAFGNGFNDVNMLKWSGLGVAIGDSEGVVIDVADDVALSVEQDGVARYIDQLLETRRIGAVGN